LSGLLDAGARTTDQRSQFFLADRFLSRSSLAARSNSSRRASRSATVRWKVSSTMRRTSSSIAAAVSSE